MKISRIVGIKKEDVLYIIVVSEKSCGAVVYRGNGISRLYLLLEYVAGHWGFPKGHIEEGESEQQTALREMGEETGITDFSLRDGFRGEIRYSFHRGDNTVDKRVIFFILEAGADEVKLSSEHIDYRWLTYSEAREKLTYDNTKHLIDKVEDFLNSTS